MFHLKSMTAYGRAVKEFQFGRFTVEIQSVNRRHLEVNINLPRLLLRFETALRKKISQQIGRGSINVFISWKNEAKQAALVVPNIALAKAVTAGWEKIAQATGIKESPTLALLSQEKDILLFEEELVDEEIYREALESALDKALLQLIEMKEKEGNLLAEDLEKRLAFLQGQMGKIQDLSQKTVEKTYQKLKDRLEELFKGSSENEERLLREIALYAEKLDITEEIVRFHSHLTQFRQGLEKPLEDAETRGKALDFLIQELNREVNTVGSKSSDATVSQLVVTIKSELEKIREQVQNIE